MSIWVPSPRRRPHLHARRYLGSTVPSPPEWMTPVMSRRRAATWLRLTLVVPGSAQLCGNWRLGQAGVRIWLYLILGATGYGCSRLPATPRTSASARDR